MNTQPFGQTTECGFTLKRVRDMTRTYSQFYVNGLSTDSKKTGGVDVLMGLLAQNSLQILLFLNSN